jgi:hypothetical protein
MRPLPAVFMPMSVVALVLLAAACGPGDPSPPAVARSEATSIPATTVPAGNAAAASVPETSAPLASVPAPPRRLHHAARSPEELASRILAAVTASDHFALAELRVDEREHNELLWPEFSAKDRNVPVDFAWQMLNSRSHTNAGRAIAAWGGKTLDLVAVNFERGVERYPTFALHRGTVLTASTPAGELVELRFVGSLLELDGQWKALSFKD